MAVNYDSNIETWKSFAKLIQTNIDSFAVNVEALQEQINDIKSSIAAIEARLDNIDVSESWVVLSDKSIKIKAANKAAYTDSIGVFSDNSTGTTSTIYVYSKETVAGLYIKTPNKDEWIQVTSMNEQSQKSGGAKYFATIENTKNGSRMWIKTDNLRRNRSVDLLFSVNNYNIIPDFNQDNKQNQKLTINVEYALTNISNSELNIKDASIVAIYSNNTISKL